MHLYQHNQDTALNTVSISHCKQIKRISQCTYRVFDINDVTTLVPLGHAVMPEHRPGETYKQIVLFADECCFCLRGSHCAAQVFTR